MKLLSVRRMLKMNAEQETERRAKENTRRVEMVDRDSVTASTRHVGRRDCGMEERERERRRRRTKRRRKGERQALKEGERRAVPNSAAADRQQRRKWKGKTEAAARKLSGVQRRHRNADRHARAEHAHITSGPLSRVEEF